MDKPAVFIHPLADVLSNTIGEGTRIWQFAVVLNGARIGRHCNINCHTFVENDVVLGDHVTVKSGVFLWNGVRAGNHVFIGPAVAFVNDRTPRSQQYPEHHIGATLEDYVSIGANATIMGGITIGRGAMIGAASMVTRDVPPCTLWYGNPARHKGYVTLDGTLLNMDLTDPKTGEQYLLNGNEILKK
jgi:UDP-2-acetamido-3-amino-2,3-dideoxy-glucuronate N-acetyltransferase